MTESFYDDGQAVFESPIEYEQVDPSPDRPIGSVDFAPFLRSTAAALGATAVMLCSSVAFTSPATIDPRIFVSMPRPFPTVEVPTAHQRMGQRVRSLFRAVPLSASEKIADPDYGL